VSKDTRCDQSWWGTWFFCSEQGFQYHCLSIGSWYPGIYKKVESTTKIICRTTETVLNDLKTYLFRSGSRLSPQHEWWFWRVDRRWSNERSVGTKWINQTHSRINLRVEWYLQGVTRFGCDPRIFTGQNRRKYRDKCGGSK